MMLHSIPKFTYMYLNAIVCDVPIVLWTVTLFTYGCWTFCLHGFVIYESTDWLIVDCNYVSMRDNRVLTTDLYALFLCFLFCVVLWYCNTLFYSFICKLEFVFLYIFVIVFLFLLYVLLLNHHKCCQHKTHRRYSYFSSSVSTNYSSGCGLADNSPTN